MSGCPEGSGCALAAMAGDPDKVYSMRIISFNCEGIKNAREKGLFDWLLEQDADLICLQGYP